MPLFGMALGAATGALAGGLTDSPPPRGTTGLYHFAILYRSRAALAEALRRLMKAGVPLDGASDHGVSEALYLRDPDGNGVELYHDLPQSIGHATRTARWRCIRSRWTYRDCSPGPKE